MSEHQTAYRTTETALPSRCLAETPPYRSTDDQIAQMLSAEQLAEVEEHAARANWDPDDTHTLYLARCAYRLLSHVRTQSKDVDELRGLLESIQHAVNADTMPADEALEAIRALVAGVGR